MRRIVAHGIAHVILRAVSAGHVPTAPPLIERGAMVGDHGIAAEGRHPVRPGIHGAHQDARNPQRAQPLVTLQAGIAAPDLGGLKTGLGKTRT
ncbi:MAG TPA: hypothetical protein VG096_00750 [Bryobacteraceae bacterium]|nr:hypothetical protein [Bryobacteraceae bacterium]